MVSLTAAKTKRILEVSVACVKLTTVRLIIAQAGWSETRTADRHSVVRDWLA